MRRHEHIGATGRFRATFQHTIVHGSHLIGMVREVGCRPSVIERELSANEQRTLMMRSRERSAEGSAGLAIAHETVGKEHAL